MNFILLIIVGLIAGAAAKFLMPGEDPGNLDDVKGIAITILIGVVGSIIGGFVGGIIGMDARGLIAKIIMATIGALLFLWGYKKYKEKKAE